MTAEEQINAILDRASERIRVMLTPIKKSIKNMSDKESKDIIARYSAAIEGNFVPWLAAGVIQARSIQGRYACAENLEVEISQKHQEMLRYFYVTANAEPDTSHFRAVSSAVSSVRCEIARGRGLETLALLATLEMTSSIFIPVLGVLAKQRNHLSDLTYVEVHGSADTHHAAQLRWALKYEAKYQDEQGFYAGEGCKAAVCLLQAIFAPSSKKSGKPF